MKKNILLLGIVIILAIIPLYTAKNAEFGGADDKAKSAIGELNPKYEQWFNSVWEPPSGEVASLLFTLQACFGTGLIAYYIGLSKGRKEKNEV